MSMPLQQRSQRLQARWLLCCAACLIAVLVVGGLTRLLHAGLSIVHWQPISGIVPPLNDTNWQELFRQYQGSPEFQQINADMSLAEFRTIFWWEYAHRLLARSLGLVFILPLLVFAWQRQISAWLGKRLLLLLGLGLLQGFLGWYMVASGLQNDPQVSPLRLAAHLGTALAILGLLVWTAWSLDSHHAPPRVRPALVWLLVPAVYVQLLLGALAAGTHAAHFYNTFPTMNGEWVPSDLLRLSPAIDNLWFNPALIQFCHRGLAALLVFGVVTIAWRLARQACVGVKPAWLAVATIVMQLSLGVATVLSVGATYVAACHQLGGVAVWLSVLWLVFQTNQKPA